MKTHSRSILKSDFVSFFSTVLNILLFISLIPAIILYFAVRFSSTESEARKMFPWFTVTLPIKNDKDNIQNQDNDFF